MSKYILSVEKKTVFLFVRGKDIKIIVNLVRDEHIFV